MDNMNDICEIIDEINNTELLIDNINEQIRSLTLSINKEILITNENKDFIEIKENNIEEQPHYFRIEQCLNNNRCTHIVMFYMKNNMIHSSVLMTKNYIIDLLSRNKIKIPVHFLRE